VVNNFVGRRASAQLRSGSNLGAAMTDAALVPFEIPDTALAPVPGAVLMAYQQRWVADRSPLKVMEKSRRTGITWGEASDNVLTAASQRTAGGQNVYYIAYNQDMTIEYIQACAMWARVFNYAAGEIEEGFWDGEDEADKAIKTYTIRFPSGLPHRGAVQPAQQPARASGRDRDR
jgi:phage FluMu gp28-like protein